MSTTATPEMRIAQDEVQREAWDQPVDYCLRPQAWMIGPIHFRLVEIARAADGLRGVTAVLRESALRADAGDQALSARTTGALLEAALALVDGIDRMVNDLCDLDPARLGLRVRVEKAGAV